VSPQAILLAFGRDGVVMRHSFAAGMVLLLLLAGCAVPEPPAARGNWTPLACDKSGVTWIGRNAGIAPEYAPDLEGQARAFVSLTNDTLGQRLFQRNSTSPPFTPLAGQWLSAQGTVLMETGSMPDGTADEAWWEQRTWLYQARRTWPAAEGEDAADALLPAVASFTGIDAGQLHDVIGGEADEGKVTVDLVQSLGELANITVAHLDMRFHAQLNQTKFLVMQGIAVKPGTQLLSRAQLIAAADAFVPCWLAAQPPTNQTARLVQGGLATHVLDGSVVEEVGYLWEPPATRNGCLGTRPVGIVVDAESGAIREVRVSPVFASCRPA